MPVFNRDDYQLRSCMNTLLCRMVGHQEQPLTMDDALSFYPPEHREMATVAPKIFALNYRSQAFSLKLPAGGLMASVVIQYNVDDAPLVPRKLLDLQHASPELRDKIMAWVEHRSNISRQFGIATKIYEHLNHACKNVNQMAFYMPTIGLVMNVSPDNFQGKLAALKSGKQPQAIPSIDPWVRKHIEEASGMIAAATIMPEPEQARTPVSLNVGGWSQVRIDGILVPLN